MNIEELTSGVDWLKGNTMLLIGEKKVALNGGHVNFSDEKTLVKCSFLKHS